MIIRYMSRATSLPSRDLHHGHGGVSSIRSAVLEELHLLCMEGARVGRMSPSFVPASAHFVWWSVCGHTDHTRRAADRPGENSPCAGRRCAFLVSCSSLPFRALSLVLEIAVLLSVFAFLDARCLCVSPSSAPQFLRRSL
uniref:Mat-1 protein n=1 Tax=Leishmania infantum TaxID=5671 RepID=Q9U9A2_LEIIN|nr:Mat-1 protein [Leishmania infantum]